MNSGQFSYTFTYNDEGISTSKTDNGVTHTYFLSGSQIESEKFGNTLLIYIYDAEGAPIGMQYRTASMPEGQFYTFWFEKNLQGDVIAVYTENGVKIGSYTYDAWGNCTVSTESGTTTIQKQIVRTLNPFRYRGYYYDTDTGLYYLQSRYYVPQWGRFLNADGYVNANGDIIGFNMYAYCGNNPVRFMDPGGEWIIEIIVACVLVVGALTMSSCSSESTPTVPQDDGVYYDVPCYKQGSTDLCGLYCQVMIEDYDMNTIRTHKQVNSRVRELQTQIYGTYDPSRPTNPTNRGTALPIENIETLGQYLSNGPIYAQYTSSIGSHMVVVCGVDTRNNIVYTCNPWGIKSSQTYAEFISGPTRNWYIPSEDWSLYCYYDVKR